MSSFSRELKMIISSILFKNSGAKAFFKAFSMVALALASVFDFLAEVPNPTPSPKSFKSLVPMLEVKMIIVFLKSTFLPKESVT